MGTEIPVSPTSESNHYLCVIVDQFSEYIVAVPTPQYNF